MSSATTSLFVSVALAGIGAAGFAYTLTHPGIVADVATHVLAEAPPAWSAADNPNPEPDAKAASNGPRLSAEAAGTVSIPSGAYGHFETAAEINGRSVDVMVDTGASLVALTYEDASHLGIYVNPGDFTNIAKTANGTARVAAVMISRISIGDITVRNVPAVVSERGKSERTLLGMSFLGRLSRVEMRGGTLVLEE